MSDNLDQLMQDQEAVIRSLFHVKLKPITVRTKDGIKVYTNRQMQEIISEAMSHYVVEKYRLYVLSQPIKEDTDGKS